MVEKPFKYASLKASKQLVEAGIVLETDMSWWTYPTREGCNTTMKRYDTRGYDCRGVSSMNCMVEADDGDYILYSEAIQGVAELKARVSELEVALRLNLAVSPDDPLITPAEKAIVTLMQNGLVEQNY